MYQKMRLAHILDIMKKQGYVTVRQLVDELFYSTATINRDLNILEKQGLIKRTYGGAEPVEQQGVPLPFRYDKMRVEKRKIAKAAARCVEPGDILFIDGSTTTQSMAYYLLDKKDLKVITNNLSLATTLSEGGIEVVVLGGAVAEQPFMLNGDITVANAATFHADKVFFSTGSVTRDGKIGSGIYRPLHRVMLENADKAYYMVDHDKLDKHCERYLCTLDKMDVVISDFAFPAETQSRFPETAFLAVE